MKVEEQLTATPVTSKRAPLPPGPKGHPILGVMPEFNRDTLGFIERCREYGDVVRSRFLYVYAYFLYNPQDIETLLATNARSYRKAGSLRSLRAFVAKIGRAHV